jgi:DNA-binding NarL/FixJ family response regulator
MTKIIIADDHQIVIDGIQCLLNGEKGVTIIGEALNGKLLLESDLLSEAELILMDISMPEMDGVEASKLLRKSHPELKILVLTTYVDHRKIKEMLKIGVSGYLVKESGKGPFLEAIAKIMRGETYYDSRVTDVVMSSYRPKKLKDQPPTPLTNREKEVIRLIADGMNTAEIAAALFLSVLTIETHRKNIFTKLGINKVARLVRYAVEEGLVD